jgi:hypothetical protein
MQVLNMTEYRYGMDDDHLSPGQNYPSPKGVPASGPTLPDSNLACPEHPLAVAARSSRPLGWKVVV